MSTVYETVTDRISLMASRVWSGLCRHFLRNLTGHPSLPQEQKIGDTLCLRRPAPSGVAPPRTLRCDGAPP
jgi:hypothetical protein